MRALRLLQAARPWNRALAAPPDSLLQQAVPASTTLAAEPGGDKTGTATLGATGSDSWGTVAPGGPAACQERQLEQLMAAAERSGATKVQHYVLGTRGGTIDAANISGRLRTCQACGSAGGGVCWRSGVPAPSGD